MQNKINAVCGFVGAIVALTAINAQATVSTTSYDYDLDVGTVTTTDANSKRIVSHYDVVNRLDKIELPDMNGGLQLFDFGYDDTDQLTSATYPGGSQTFGYDGLDRLDSVSEFGITDLVKLEYDHQDRVTAIIYGNNNGVACYQYDPDGRLTKVGRILTGNDSSICKDVAVEWTLYNYDAKGRLDTRTYPNGVQSYWDYNSITGQLMEVGHKKADGTLIYSDAFVYIPGTNLYDKITRTDANGLKTTDYDYDAYQRLTSVTEPDDRSTVYQYDDFGNRTYQTITHADDQVEQYRYVYDGNRLTDIFYTPKGSAEQATALEQFGYDNVGRIETRNHSSNGLTTYTWDDRGYLIGLIKPGTTISYTYNALGARTSKTVNGVTTKYVTAPVFGMNHVLMELDETNGVTNRYVYGGHQQLIQEPTPGNVSNDQYLLHGGSVGNITHAMSRTQAVVNQYDYDAFGSRTTVLGGNSITFGYTGEQYDSETGLLYLRARYYDPMLGRFITVDPYLGRMGEPVTQNRYIYVRNNPFLYTDPTGNFGVFGCGVGFFTGLYDASEAGLGAFDSFVVGGVGCVFGGLTGVGGKAATKLAVTFIKPSKPVGEVVELTSYSGVGYVSGFSANVVSQAGTLPSGVSLDPDNISFESAHQSGTAGMLSGFGGFAAKPFTKTQKGDELVGGFVDAVANPAVNSMANQLNRDVPTLRNEIGDSESNCP